MERMTFFKWLQDKGQAEVSRQLGPPFYPVRVHRAARAKHKVDEPLLDRCEEVLGDRFDRVGTLAEWYRLRKENREKKARPMAGRGGAA